MGNTEHDQLLGVEARHLIALEAIARTGSFSKAAAELGYAQSAVSQQIATLERATGHKLVERGRGPKPVALTEAGVIVLRHAERMAARLGALRADLDALDAGELGSLRVGVFQSASARLLPAVLARFRDAWPRIDVKLHSERDTPALDRLVLGGELDLSFSMVQSLPDGLSYRELMSDPYVVLVPPTSPLAALDEMDLHALDGADLIAQDARDSCSMPVERAIDAARISTRVVFRTEDNLTVQRLVGTGLGCAVVPRLTIEEDAPAPNGVIVPLAAASAFERRIGIVWHRDRYRSPAARGFVQAAIEVVGSAAPGAVGEEVGEVALQRGQ
jgi:molybdate transport repressor ModE-like protein